MRAIVVTPTFNEKDNVADLIQGVLNAHPNLHIVIVHCGRNVRKEKKQRNRTTATATAGNEGK